MKLEEAQALVANQRRMTEQEIVDFLKTHIQSIDYEDDVSVHIIENGPHYVQAQGRSGFGKAVHYEVVNQTKKLSKGIVIRLDDERGRHEDSLKKALDAIAEQQGIKHDKHHWLAFPNALNCDQPPSEVVSRIWEGLRKLYDAFEATLVSLAKPKGARKQQKSKKYNIPCETIPERCSLTGPSQPIDNNLENILKDNPFLASGLLDSWERKLEKLRNRQCAPCDLDFDFVLDDDKEFLESTAKGKKQSVLSKLRTKLLPQPMVGHPQAPVWILLLNPGFGEKDYYDHVSVSEKTRRCLMVNAPESYSDKSFDPTGVMSEEKLVQRQELMLSSLRCQTWPAPFYILDKAFKTGSAEVDDGWHWWSKRLRLGKGTNSFFPQNFCKTGEEANAVGRSLFVLEAFPYHSKTFPTGMVEKWAKQGTAYFKFWKRLVKYGLKHKEIIIRAQRQQRGALVSLLDQAGLNALGANVHFVNSVRNVSFTQGNVENHGLILDAINNVLAFPS